MQRKWYTISIQLLVFGNIHIQDAYYYKKQCFKVLLAIHQSYIVSKHQL